MGLAAEAMTLGEGPRAELSTRASEQSKGKERKGEVRRREKKRSGKERKREEKRGEEWSAKSPQRED